MTVFSKQWFKKHNKQLCWLANSFIGDFIFKISKMGHDKKKYGKITEMHPNAITHKQRLLYDFEKRKIEQEYTTQFFSRNEYALRLQKVFYPIWLLFHGWDMLIANPFKPAWNLGFDTLTVYPDTSTGATTVDGTVKRASVSESFAAIIIGDGNAIDATANDSYFSLLQIVTAPSTFSNCFRSIFTFDTSSLTADATISAGVLSLYGTSKLNGLGDDTLEIVSSTPTANNNLQNSDYGQLGSTSFGNITYAGFNEAGYNDVTLSDGGKANISKISISKFGARGGWDRAGSYGGGTSSGRTRYNGYFADNGSNKPKLVVTYTSTVDYEMVAALGTFTLTGIANSLTSARNMIASLGTFTLTGIDILFSRGKAIIVEVGNFALTGIDTTLTSTRSMIASAGSFALTGIAAGLTSARKIAIATGSFILTGITTGTSFARTIVASVGTFTLTGIAAIFVCGKVIVASVGEFILNGIDVRLKRGWRKRIIKNITTFTKQEKQTTNFSKQEKRESSWTKQPKP